VTTVGVDTPRAGACLVRAEVQGEHVLISITVSSDLDRNRHAARVEAPRHFVDVDQALAVVSDFLHSFSVPSRPGSEDVD
jgi:hypothetical protein